MQTDTPAYTHAHATQTYTRTGVPAIPSLTIEISSTLSPTMGVPATTYELHVTLLYLKPLIDTTNIDNTDTPSPSPTMTVRDIKAESAWK